MVESEEATIEKMRVEQQQAQETLESNAEKTLTKLRGSDGPTPDESKSESTSEQTDDNQTDESQETDESTSKQTDESESKDESTSEETSEQTDDTDDSKAGDESKLTQAEVRAVIHLGWSEEEIKELEQANPDLAKKTCGKALESTNSLSKKFSELGKTQVAKPAEPVAPAAPVAPTVRESKSIDFTTLEKEYENDPIAGVLKQIAEQNQTLAAEVATLRDVGVQGDAKVTAAQVQQDAAVAQQIDTFFVSPDVTAYKGVYGEVEKGSKDWDNLTGAQVKKRYAVVEEANLILKGAEQQGMNMPLEEAFERAHLLVTADVREQVIRKDIKAKTVKRSKSLTLAPTSSKSVPDTGKKTMAKTHANAERTLAKLRKGR